MEYWCSFLFLLISRREKFYIIFLGKDVDGFHPYNLGRLMIGDPVSFPALLGSARYCCVIICPPKENVVIVGRSNIVGKPLAMMLVQKGRANATVSMCHTGTRNLSTIPGWLIF